MFGFIFRAPAWQLISQADFMTKFVLSCLFIVSVFCISIAISKFWTISAQKRKIKRLQDRIKRVKTFDGLVKLSKEYKNTIAGKFLVSALGDLKNYLESEGGKSKISSDDLENIQLLVEQNLDDALAVQEEYLPVLGTSAAAAPLIGLFGTVWGLVHAFVDISRSKSADISVVAPGIAEALTTTLGGLIVAIPALIFFHYFSNEIRKLEKNLWAMSDKFLSIVRNSFLI